VPGHACLPACPPAKRIKLLAYHSCAGKSAVHAARHLRVLHCTAHVYSLYSIVCQVRRASRDFGHGRVNSGCQPGRLADSQSIYALIANLRCCALCPHAPCLQCTQELGWDRRGAGTGTAAAPSTVSGAPPNKQTWAAATATWQRGEPMVATGITRALTKSSTELAENVKIQGCII
jgi:hypothetical protein